MLKKVSDDAGCRDDGEALVENDVTSVTTGRTMAEIAAGRGRLALQSRRARRRPGETQGSRNAAAQISPRRNWRHWSTRCRPANGWLHEYKYDGYRLLLAVGDGVGHGLDPQRQGLERQVQGAGEGRGNAAGRLPDRRRGRRARRRTASRASSCSRRRSRTGKAPTLLSRLRPARSTGARTSASSPTSSARSGSPRCSRACAARSSMAIMSIGQGRGAVRGDVQAGRRGDYLEEGRRALTRHPDTRTGSRSSASTARNS